jgi:hypothetical protein
VLFRAQKNAQIRSSFNGGGCWLGEREFVTREEVLISNFTAVLAKNRYKRVYSGC